MPHDVSKMFSAKRGFKEGKKQHDNTVREAGSTAASVRTALDVSMANASRMHLRHSYEQLVREPSLLNEGEEWMGVKPVGQVVGQLLTDQKDCFFCRQAEKAKAATDVKKKGKWDNAGATTKG
jgi:hypothetical protein